MNSYIRERRVRDRQRVAAMSNAESVQHQWTLKRRLERLKLADELRGLAEKAGPYVSREGKWVLIQDTLLIEAAHMIERTEL